MAAAEATAEVSQLTHRQGQHHLLSSTFPIHENTTHLNTILTKKEHFPRHEVQCGVAAPPGFVLYLCTALPSNPQYFH